MSAAQAPRGDHPGPDRYEVRVKGHLAGRWAAWFDGLTLTPESDGTTLIEGPVVDQAALHGLLQKVRDTGMPLVSVEYVEHVEPAPPASSTATPDNSSTLQGD